MNSATGPQPAMRNAELKWLAEVPTHWRRIRLGWVAEMVSGSTPSKSEKAYWDGDVPWVSPKDMKRTEISDSIDHITRIALHETGIKLIEPPAVLIVVRGMILAHSFPVARILAPVTINQDMKALKFRQGIGDRFATYLLIGLRDVILGEVEAAAHGTRILRTDRWKHLEAHVPPEPEQVAIADFLDRETAKIDALIDKKQRLLELLEEKRTALITQAVTKGLDPEVEMKDSGVEWLAEIPTHWEAVQLKYVADLQTGFTLGQESGDGETVVRPYLRVANVQDGYLALDDIAEVEVSVARAHRHELEAGDVLMTEGGDFDKLGRGAVWTGEIPDCLHQNHIFAVRPAADSLRPRFLAAILEGAYARRYFTATAKQSTNLASTNSTKVRNFPLALPPYHEQAEITRGLDTSLARLDELRDQVTAGVRLLREYRTAVVSAAVTGKIDLRQEVA